MISLEKYAQLLRGILKKIPFLESKYYFILKFMQISHSSREIRFKFCSLCGKNSLLIFDNSQLGDTGYCFFCTANERNRVLVEILKKILIIKLLCKNRDLKNQISRITLTNYSLKTILKAIKFENIVIYEPSSIGAIYNKLKNYSKFIFSEYFPYSNLKKGQYFRNILFEDLQDLSFIDNYFDIVITQDVLEHVENPYLAFKEIYRVLKPNGIHIFTVPIGNNERTFQYFDDKGKPLFNRVVFHNDPLRQKGAKVYTQFGIDIVEILNDFHFSSFIISTKKNSVIISIKKIERSLHI